MKNKPLVSVYITNYNYEKFIQESIESVLSQTMQNFELIIIDDGSKDNSKKIIETYREHPKVRIIYQQNKGLNVTNNVAMRTSKGVYIMRLDADDYLRKDALFEMTNVLESNPDLGLVFPDYYYIDAQGEIIGEEIRHDFDKDVSLYDQPAHGACTMIRLENLKTLGGYNESFTCQDGYDLWIKFIMHFNVNNINKPLFYYRQHGNNLTGDEARILATRKKIKETYVDSSKMETPKTVAIIPVRNAFINDINWPLYKKDDVSILEKAIISLIKTKKVDWIVVTTSDKEILTALKKIKIKYDDEFIVIERPKQYSGSNVTLYKTYNFVLEELAKNNINPEAILSLALEFPFVTSDIIDDAIYTLTIFKADSLLSVRPDNKMYYQHIGHGLQPILDQEKYTKLEREALYKGQGGVVLSTVTSFKQNKKILAGKVSHIVVDEKAAIGVFSKFDFRLFNMLIQ